MKIAIITAALAAASLLIAGCGDTANKANAGKNTTSNTNKAAIPASAPAGAQPPNAAGPQTATVTVEEFADFQCGSCAVTEPVLNEIKAAYGSRIRFIFRNFPLKIPAHDKAYDAAVAAEAAGMQGKFWEMKHQLFQSQQEWTANPNYKQLWAGYAQKIGLDVAKWQDEAAGLGAKNRVNADLERGTAIGVSSTPSIYINGILVPFSSANVNGLKNLIDAELQKAPQGAPVAGNTAPASNAAPASNSNTNTNSK